MQFWHEMQKAFSDTQFKFTDANPCLYHEWLDGQLMLSITWVDCCLLAGCAADVQSAKVALMNQFNYEEIQDANEYVSCKHDVDISSWSMH